MQGLDRVVSLRIIWVSELKKVGTLAVIFSSMVIQLKTFTCHKKAMAPHYVLSAKVVTWELKGQNSTQIYGIV